MQLRKRTMNEIVGDPKRQKAVAIAVCMKHALGRDSTIRNYNPNKVHTLTGVNANTFRKYIGLITEMGLVRFEGKDGEHLVVCCLHSSDSRRNIDISRFCFRSFTEVYRSLRSFLALLIQRRKDYVRRTLQIARDPKKGDDFAAARKQVKRLVKHGILRSVYDKAEDYGLSLKRIARETGNCVRTAQRIVSYAVRKRWWRKERHFDYTYMPGVNRMPVPGFTFTTRNHGCVVSANTYRLNSALSL